MILEKKNSLLQPVFRDLKSMIRHMTFTEEYRVMRDYVQAKAKIIKNFVHLSQIISFLGREFRKRSRKIRKAKK